jgi:hypothetical protein
VVFLRRIIGHSHRIKKEMTQTKDSSYYVFVCFECQPFVAAAAAAVGFLFLFLFLFP